MRTPTDHSLGDADLEHCAPTRHQMLSIRKLFGPQDFRRVICTYSTYMDNIYPVRYSISFKAVVFNQKLKIEKWGGAVSTALEFEFVIPPEIVVHKRPDFVHVRAQTICSNEI